MQFFNINFKCVKNLVNKPSKIQKDISTPTLWGYYLSNTRFRILALGSLLFSVFAIKFITNYLAIVDLQVGTLLYDPLHAFLPAAIDWSNIIFFLTYTSVFVVTIDVILKSPMQLVRLGFAIGLMKVLRSFSMFLLPLEPPVGIIALQDPIVSFMTPNQIVALRDLFFSGHCATMMILLLVAVSPIIKQWMRFIIVIVPLLILWQRVHYTIDVIAGIAVGYGVYWLVQQLVVLGPNVEESYR